MNTNGIGNLQTPLLQQTAAAQKSTAEANAAHAKHPAAATSSTDQASLSHVSTLLAQALTTSDVRADKVASLQQAINSGSYNVSSSDVADKLLKSLME